MTLHFNPFATLEDAVRFIEWHESHEYHTQWDDDKYEYAKNWIDLLVNRPPTLRNE